MGFRGLILFNKVLFTKQVWRVIANPDSLVSKVFRARYFKHTNIMGASLGSNPSYIWRSILWTRDILNKGLYWKVENGENIHAKRDVWIPNLTNGKITSNVTYDSNVKVNPLILNSKTWDTNKLHNLFLSYNVEAIKCIPIASNNCLDARYWKFKKRGTALLNQGIGITHPYLTRLNPSTKMKA